jgi:uncharacterized protein YraI
MLLVRTWIWSAAMLAISSGLAAAMPATLERSAKVHSGPGTKYQVIATLRRGTVIDVSGCGGAWCEVAWRGRQGYVAHTLLAAGPVPAAAGVAPGQAYYVDDYPGFDYPGYAYEPSIVVAPRRYRRSGRWPGWHHRFGGTGWAGRPDPLPTGATPGVRMPRAGNFAPGPNAPGGGVAGARSTLATGAAANSVRGSIGTGAAPIVSAPIVSVPTVSAPAAPASSAPSANAPAPR